MVMERWWNYSNRVIWKDLGGGTCLTAILSTTNLTWTDLGLSRVLCYDGPTTNRLRHDTAHVALKALKNHTMWRRYDLVCLGRLNNGNWNGTLLTLTRTFVRERHVNQLYAEMKRERVFTHQAFLSILNFIVRAMTAGPLACPRYTDSRPSCMSPLHWQ